MMAGRSTNGAGGDPSPPASPSSSASPLDLLIASLTDLDAGQLCLRWRNHLGGKPPAHLPRWLLARVLAQRLQAAALGDPDKATLRMLRQTKGDDDEAAPRPFMSREPTTRDGVNLKVGSLLVREWNGALQRVMVLEKGFAWNGKTYRSLSQIAKAMTGTSWNGHRFFGLRPARSRGGEKAMRHAVTETNAIGVRREARRAGHAPTDKARSPQPEAAS
jgi:Protein of unknown function (DUF2924)